MYHRTATLLGYKVCARCAPGRNWREEGTSPDHTKILGCTQVLHDSRETHHYRTCRRRLTHEEKKDPVDFWNISEPKSLHKRGFVLATFERYSFLFCRLMRSAVHHSNKYFSEEKQKNKRIINNKKNYVWMTLYSQQVFCFYFPFNLLFVTR
jgi:hypothetical protein